YQAERGLVEPPGLPRTCLADLGGAQEAVIAAFELVLNRHQDPTGRRVEVSLADAAAWFAEPLRRGLTAAGGVLGGGFPGYNIYRARAGWIAVAALEPHFQRELAAHMGLANLDRNALQEIFLTRTADEWTEWARPLDLPLSKVLE